MSFLSTWHQDAKWERKLYLDFSKVFNNMCILRVLPELPGDVGASQVALVVKNPPANAGDIRGTAWIPGSGVSPGGQQGNPLQYSCLENPMDRGAWWVTVHGIAQSRT